MPATVLRLVSTSHKFNVTLLLLLTALLYLPGLSSLPPIDRDEARFAQATKQMLETGEYFAIRFQDTPRHKKPPGIHHLQVVAVSAAQFITGNAALRNEIWPYRIPSVVAGCYTVLLLYFFAAWIFGNRVRALLAATFLATSVLMIVESHQATTDAVLCAALTTALVTAGLLQQRQSIDQPRCRKLILPVIFWLAITFAFYLKGPIALIIPAVGCGAVCLRTRNLQLWRAVRPLVLGLPIFVGLTAGWALPLHRATGGTFWEDALFADFLPKLTSGVESHAFPPGFYLVVLMLTFWPASLVAGYALLNARKIAKQNAKATVAPTRHCAEQTCPVGFLFAALVPMWIILELVPTKLPHYVLPLYPLLALLTAIGCTSTAAGSKNPADPPSAPTPPLLPRTVQIGFVFWGFITVLFGATVSYLLRYLQQPLPVLQVIPLALTCAGVAVFAPWAAWRGHCARALTGASVACVIITIMLRHIILPANPTLWLSREIANSLRELAPIPNTLPADIVAAGYHEPSLIFLTSTQTRLLSGKRAAEYFIAHPRTATIIIDHARAGPAFRDTLQQHGYRLPEPLVRHLGYNYSKGTWTIVQIYRNLPPLQPDIRHAHATP